MDLEDHNRRVVDQFTRWAQRFSALPIHAEADAMAKTLDACAIAPTMRVLDVACGPGILTCTLAQRAASVIGVDLTQAMLTEAAIRQAELGLSNVTWQVGDATALPFPDAHFDCVVTRYSFHHLPNPMAALADMQRVCRPGGRIVVIDATPAPEKQAAYDAMERLRDPSHTTALTVDQLQQAGEAAGLQLLPVDRYRLEAQLATLADAETLDALNDLFNADIASQQDRIGVEAWQAPDGIRFFFPISIIAWKKLE